MDALMEPPEQYALKLPLLELPRTRWYRVHQSRHDPVYFNRQVGFRFNAPMGQFGVLYASETTLGALAEAFLGTRTRPPIVTASRLRSRSISALEWDSLSLADLTGSGLAALGLDARIASTADYELTRCWAAWIEGHPAHPDGICYFARNAPGIRSIAVFERAGQPRTTLVEHGLVGETDELRPCAREFAAKFEVSVIGDGAFPGHKETP